MKKINALIAAATTTLFLSSCVVYSEHKITGNPLGTKVGYVKTKLKKDFTGVPTAAEKGGITKIATVDIKYYMSGKVSIRVTGE